MAADKATTPAPNKSTDSTSSSKPSKKKAELEVTSECRHSVFQFTPKRARQICNRCGAVRRINLKGDCTATVGPWRNAEG